MVLDYTWDGSIQEAYGEKLIGESLKDVGRLDPSQLEWGLEVKTGEGDTSFDFCFVRVFSLKWECIL